MKHYLFTLLAAVGLAAPFVSPSAQAAQGDASFVAVTNSITSDTRWTRDKVYILTRMIFVRNNATLTIEPGTVIRGAKKGAAGTDFLREPGTLVISRTGKLIANGTPDAPIVFTSIDDPNVPGGIQTVPKSFRNAQGNVKTVVPKNYATDGPTATNGFAYCEEWGGLVILGRTFLAQGTGLGPLDGTRVFNDNGLVSNDSVFKSADVIEGIDATQVPDGSGAGSLKLGVHGGLDDNDNSGVIRFVSVRYCGDVIGASNELNSITMGSMGYNTVFEHNETTFNTDDAFEWFGGKVDHRFLFSHYNRDDQFDCDEGVRITGQFFSCVQGSDIANRSGFGNNTPTGHTLNSTGGNFYNHLMEIDGPEPDGSGQLPATQVDVFNFTFLGNGNDAPDGEGGIRYRLGANGNLFNGICELSFGVNPTGISKTTFNANAANSYILNVDRLWLSGFTVSPVNGAASNSFTAATNQTSGASNVTTNAPLTINGYDPRIPLGSPARVQQGGAFIPSTAAGSGFTNATNNPNPIFVPVRYSGSQRDNTQLQGWSHIQKLDLLPVAHPERIQITLGLSGDNPTVTFDIGDYVGEADATVSNRAIFVVERSADGRIWVPVTTAIDGDAGDENVASGTVTVTDTATDIDDDGLMLYRAYAL